MAACLACCIGWDAGYRVGEITDVGDSMEPRVLINVDEQSSAKWGYQAKPDYCMKPRLTMGYS